MADAEQKFLSKKYVIAHHLGSSTLYFKSSIDINMPGV